MGEDRIVYCPDCGSEMELMAVWNNDSKGAVEFIVGCRECLCDMYWEAKYEGTYSADVPLHDVTELRRKWWG